MADDPFIHKKLILAFTSNDYRGHWFLHARTGKRLQNQNKKCYNS